MNQERAVIIIGPPWLRTGTGRVIEAQIAYYRDRGYRTTFIGVAVEPAHVVGDPIWRRYKEAAGDLHADCVSIAALSRTPKARKKIRRIRHFLRRNTALDWIVEVASLSDLPDDAIAFARDNPPALFHVNHVYTLGFAKRLNARLSARGKTIPMIVETHDVQAHILHDRNYENPWTRQLDTLARLTRSETKQLSAADALVHISLDDLEFFTAQLPNKPHILAMPTLDHAMPAGVGDDAPVAPIDLLFIGTGHIANLLAIKWLLCEVWPHIADSGFKLTIAGGINELVRLQLPELYERFRSYFVGPIADVVPYYRAARCVIAPMISGRGISIKTIEAFAFAKPFVGTSKAFRGMPLNAIRASGLRTYDDAREFADGIIKVLRVEAGEGVRNRAVYDSLFSKSAYYQALDSANRLVEAVTSPAGPKSFL